MSRPFLILAATFGLVTATASQSHAQLSLADPFTAYFGFYLPRQAALATQPTPLDTINAVTAVRQQSVMMERAGLYDPISPYAEEEVDPLRPFSRSRSRDPVAAHTMAPMSNSAATTRGLGPQLYYNRSARYYPNLRTGRGPNRNLAVHRNSRMSGGMGMSGVGGAGMGGAGMGMGPGVR